MQVLEMPDIMASRARGGLMQIPLTMPDVSDPTGTWPVSNTSFDDFMEENPILLGMFLEAEKNFPDGTTTTADEVLEYMGKNRLW